MPEPSISLEKMQWYIPAQTNTPIQVFSKEIPKSLSAYISDTLKHNHNLKELAVTVQASEIVAEIASGRLLPQADISQNTQRDNSGAGAKPQTGFSVSGNVSWAIDLWGKISDEAAAAQLHAQAEQQNYLNLKRVLIAQALDAWIIYWQFRQQNTILADLSNIDIDQLSLLRDRYESGLASYAQYTAQNNIKRDTAIRTETALVEQKKILHLLNVLRGKLPLSDLDMGDAEFMPVFLPINEYVPATYIASRPDIQAAFKRVQILDKETQASYKALLPQINITGNLTKSAPSLADLFGEKLIWQMVGGLTQPVFNGGQLRRQAQKKSKEAQSAFYAYEGAVLKAMQEVENALVQDHTLNTQLQIMQAKMAGVKGRLISAEEQYHDGNIQAFEYLSVRKEYLETDYEYQAMQGQYLRNRVTLVLSLGQPFGISEGIDNEE
ncbi:MAG: TolC family protein [Alphaproteobacteria bacterium]